MRDRWRLRRAVRSGQVPVVVYSMSRSASTAVFDALKGRRDILAFKTHALERSHWRRRLGDPAVIPGNPPVMTYYSHADRLVREHIVEKKRPCRFIAMVRDPVAANVSTFHYAITNWGSHPYTHSSADAERPEVLERHFFDSYPHRLAVDWFDVEPKRVLGIDVLNLGFDSVAKWQEYRNGPFELLVMRTDLPDAQKARRIEEFLGVSGLTIARVNSSVERGCQARIDALQRAMRGHPDYVDGLLASPYSLAFWKTAELADLRRRWLGE